MNTCVTAEFLTEKYVEEWRVNPTWKMKSFRARVLTDLGIEVGYGKAWLARARAKLMIYGSALEQYSRVWDYGKAVLKYNPGSKVYVVVEGVDKPEPPLFLRMYCCLSALRSGFNKGCRPLIGLDGCHLKGSYPGQILVAVGKDGNNQIFPFAWATVEVENKETWGWFLECLKNDGLLEAFEQLVPMAEKRYCVRHIWANFKLQYTGSTFKDLFWNAARATTLFDFEVAMESITFLSEDAYEYLANIPAEHWSRHAFSDFCKSNMILNNVCETFNAVIKDARDKPILTQMEWMRKYMMKRNSKKWDQIQKMEGKNTPYVAKVFERMEKVARYCIVQLSRGDSYEVELNGDKVVVDLHQRTCSCYQWQLTGIPGVHAFACILDKRTNPDDYVDEYYSRATYILAYQDAIKPMPGPKHWEKIDMPQPLPPPVRVMPGRPKSKKRKLEKGEKGEGAGQIKEPKAPKTQKRCKNCGQLGHYAKTCGNAPSTQPPPSVAASTSEAKKGGKPVQNTPWLQEQRRKKAERAARNVSYMCVLL
ncbi:uncharacterized protein LOC110692858 [Chenopodium quinoa]|uniref:uncharacterized protein LOC110692858 n=1 Tax=Chenopodium quinoa TaxID=63459 RepID=UPI000B770B35|nr:uncharacterized protein LOC110692858 [Chenopodium quinoa]